VKIIKSNLFSSIQNRTLQSDIVRYLLKINPSSKTLTETPDRTMSGLTRQCPVWSDISARHFRTYSRKPCFSRELPPDYVRSCRTMSGIWIWAQRLFSWESSINTSPPPTAQKAWSLHFPVEQAHILYSQRPISLSPRAFIPCSCLGIEWSKDSSSLCDSPPQACLGCWIFILHTCYFWSVAPRWLEVPLELPLGVVSREKICECLLHLHKEKSKS
jgi:hypothetical protein